MVLLLWFCIPGLELENSDTHLSTLDVAVKQADWDTSKVREKLRRDIEAHATSVRTAKLEELKAEYEVFQCYSIWKPEYHIYSCSPIM